MPARVLLLVLLLLQLAPGPLPGAAAPAPVILEDLEYQISLGAWSDVGRVHLVLKELEPGRYLAEVSWATQGLWQLSKRWLPERYQTEMIHREGRLVPLIFREEFISQGKRVVKEYDAFTLADKLFPEDKRHQPPLPVDHLGLVALGQPPFRQLPQTLGCPGNLRQVTPRFQLLEHQVDPAHIRPCTQADLIFQVFKDDRRRGGRTRKRPWGQLEQEEHKQEHASRHQSS